jgi:hypothetical protein
MGQLGPLNTSGSCRSQILHNSGRSWEVKAQEEVGPEKEPAGMHTREGVQRKAHGKVLGAGSRVGPSSSKCTQHLREACGC